MQSSPTANASAAMFRVDRFVVRREVLPAFMERVHRIDQMLAAMPGCKQHLVLVETSNGSEAKVVTLVEWASVQLMAAARESVQRVYARDAFDPAAFMRALGVQADLGVFQSA
jgi:heme-degrading monooxygenase HmoA